MQLVEMLQQKPSEPEFFQHPLQRAAGLQLVSAVVGICHLQLVSSEALSIECQLDFERKKKLEKRICNVHPL